MNFKDVKWPNSLILKLSSFSKIYYQLLFAGLAMGLFIAYLMTVSVKETSDAEFCASCHAMKPIKMSYEMDVHGGNNLVGFRAKCSECHLPGNSVIGYLLAKSISGASDTYKTIFKDSAKTDWEANRWRRKKYVYDSGCLECHTRLTDSPLMEDWKKEIHKEYFAKSGDNEHFSCVSCHPHVGHKNLIEYTTEFFKKK